MLNGRKLIVDTFSEVYSFLRPWIDQDFWNFAEHEIQPNSVYIIGRKAFVEHRLKIQAMFDQPSITVIFDNAAEGSWTMVSHLEVLGLNDLALQKKLLIITGGDLPPEYAHIQFDHFLSGIVDYSENLSAAQRIDEIFAKQSKPYKFLFLNGRSRPHRKYLYERMAQMKLLDSSLWTMLDGRACRSRTFDLWESGEDLMARASPIRSLPREYEFQFYKDNQVNNVEPSRSFIKNDLFNNEWGEIYLEPQTYIDTYFSLVTETVLDYPYSFRTEKIAKPLLQGHPWIAATSQYFYRDIRNLGFKTFDNVIDESFDQISNAQDRMDRIIAIVKDLCQQDLSSFLGACESVCKYNQQHLLELVPQMRAKFPQRFFEFLAQYE